MGQNTIIIFLFFLTILSIALFNSTGIAMTKYASAAQRSTIDTSRTLTIWILSISLGLEPPVWWEIPGFILLVIGTLLFNEIVVFPYWGFDQNTKAAIKKREASEGRFSARVDGTDYVATSPNAAYDSTRKERALQKKLAEREEMMGRDDGADFGMTEQDSALGVQNRSTAMDNSATNYQ